MANLAYVGALRIILAERRLIKRPLGSLALACGASDDVLAWFLVALAVTMTVAGGAGEVTRTEHGR